MTGTWQLLRSLVSEARSIADYKEDIFRYMTLRYGENAADELRDRMKSLKFGDFRRHAQMEFMDSKLDAKIEALAQAAITAHKARQGQGSPEAKPGQVSGRSGRVYTSPEDAGERQSKIDAMRQARSSHGSGGQDAGRALMTPGRGGGHAMGSAGQNQPKAQPSVAAGIQPQHSADELKKMRTARSGLVQAQRAVDKETREKGAAAGDRLAKSLGVPTTGERTQTHPDTGQKTIQVWGPDRVLKHMDQDLKSGPEFKGEPKDLPAFLRGAQASTQGSGSKFSIDSPEADRGEKLGRIDLIKRGLVKRNAAPTKLGPDRPGSFHGERWKPHGREEMAPTSRPDPTTGNWIRGQRAVNPKHTGRELVWNKHAGQWQTPSVFAAQEGERGARTKASSGFDQDEPTSRDAPAFSDEGERTDPDASPHRDSDDED